MNLNSYFEGTKFFDKGHYYTYNGTRIDRTASQIYNMFVEPFNSELLSLKVAERDNKTQQEVLNEWKKTAEDACTLGTNTHLFGERYAMDRTLEPSNGYEKAVVNFWNSVPDCIEIAGLEVVMYHKKLRYAGTSDVVLRNRERDDYIVIDYKTNGNIYKNYQGKRMLGPFNNLLDMPFNHYQIQLSLYQMLLEQIPNVRVAVRRLVWLQPDGSFKLIDTDNYCNILTQELEKRNENW